MRLPQDIARQVQHHPGLLGWTCGADGNVVEGFEAGWGGGGAYPPAGYLPWSILDVGNGDTYGYYWPLGMEGEPPIVCTLLHDEAALLPIASGLPQCVRLLLLTGRGDADELREAAEALAVPIDDIPNRDEDDDEDDEDEDEGDEEDGGGGKPRVVEFWGVPSAGELLKHDHNSPHLRLVAAREAVAARPLPRAEQHLRAALAKLPEYAEAWSALAMVRRQQQDFAGAADAAIEALTSPRCFGAPDRRKLLTSLQKMKDADYPDAADPLWRRRKELSFTGQGGDDHRVLEELIEEYHEAGMGIRAVRVRILSGELMGAQTVSEQERHRWTPDAYRAALRADLARAGLNDRLVAVRD